MSEYLYILAEQSPGRDKVLEQMSLWPTVQMWGLKKKKIPEIDYQAEGPHKLHYSQF